MIFKHANLMVRFVAALLCLLPQRLDAQVSQRQFGREGRSELATYSIILKNGNRVAVGYAFDGANSIGSDAFAMCINRGDTLLWAAEMGGQRTERFIYAYPTRDTGFVAVGYADANNVVSQPSAYVVKFTASGTVQWSRTLKNSFNGEAFWTVTEMPSNGHILCAGAYNFTPTTISSLLVDLDAAGNVLWSKSYDNSGSDAMWALVPFGNDVFALGYSQSGTLYDGYLLRVDESNGNLRWARSFDFTSLINGNTGQWPQTLSLVDNRLYMDTYSFGAFSFPDVHHSLVSFDTSGAQPHCLEYRLPGTRYSNSVSSLVRSAGEIYLAQCPGTATWDMQTNNNNQAMSDMTILKINSLNASGLTPSFCRTMSNLGAQNWRHMDYENGKIISFQAAQGDTINRLGYCDIFKIEADTAFTLNDSTCATNMPAPAFANPSVSVNTAFRFSTTTSINWSTNLTGTNPAYVYIESTLPCVAPDTVINRYAAVLEGDPCDNSFLVDSPDGFAPGDTILVIQMKGAMIDSSNTASFGTVLDPAGAGLFERNVIKSVSGNMIGLINRLSPELSIARGRLQFVTIPRYNNLTVRKRLTAMPWNGSKGGVLILDVADTLRLDAAIDVSGKGFAGGQAAMATLNGCSKMDYYYPPAGNDGAAKGEGIAELSPLRSYGRGRLANGGGGGNDFNAGGGGGANAGSGGLGGFQALSNACQVSAINGGIGGSALAPAPAAARARAFLGGGGGAGHGNNGGAGSGGSGGGIVLLKAGIISGQKRYILANGGRAPHSIGAIPGFQDDGRGGGGGGGTIIASIGAFAAPVQLSADGGRGSGAYSSGLYNAAPGGGGGGGHIWFAGSGIPAGGVNSVAPGSNGRTLQRIQTQGGAVSGSTGLVRSGFVHPPMRDSFRKNVITATIFDTLQGCRNYRFGSVITTTITGIRSYTWHFGDGQISTDQFPKHFFRENGLYNVKLKLIDSNGCEDSAVLPLNIACRDTVINRYAAVLSADGCSNTFSVDSTTGFAAGDTVLMIQMQGAVADSSNTAAFGTLLDSRNAGRYELHLISRVTPNSISLRDRLSHQFDFADGRVQFVRVASFTNYTLNQPHVCMPWNGSKGGVLAMHVSGLLRMNDELDVSGRGFRGGRADTTVRNAVLCDIQAQFVDAAPDSAARKGEGIALLPVRGARGRGRFANAGGGGNSNNTGGGGGGNAGRGGEGGLQSMQCANASGLVNGGIGGIALSYAPGSGRLFMGGGGGAGHSDESTPAHGGNGGGIILLRAGTILGEGMQARAAGSPGPGCSGPVPGCQNDGGGGGGAGGNIHLNVGTLASPLGANAPGGKGATVHLSDPRQTQLHGPGGGGGAGAVWITGTRPSLLTTDTSEGLAGFVLRPPQSLHGATAGMPGLVFTGQAAPGFTNRIFAANIIRPSFVDSPTSCFGRRFRSTAFTTTTGIAGYRWYIRELSDQPLATGAAFSYTFPAYGTYNLRLIVTDSNGCMDSSSRPITIVHRRFANAGPDTTVCRGGKALLQASGGVRYSWQPAAAVNSPNTANTIATVPWSQYLSVEVTDSLGCVDRDTMLLRIRPAPNPVEVHPADTTVCRHAQLRLRAAHAAEYRWEPAYLFNDSSAATQKLSITESVVLRVTARDTNGCLSEGDVRVNVFPAPPVDAFTRGDALSCDRASVRIYASGADSFVWHPGHLLDDSTSESPVLTTPATVQMRVEGTDRFGCTAEDTLTVFAMTDYGLYMPNAFTPNGDGLNDDIRPYTFCNFSFGQFRIFNRWGECVHYGYRQTQAWDGTYRGKPAEMGVYYFMIQGKNTSTGEDIITKGDITLIR